MRTSVLSGLFSLSLGLLMLPGAIFGASALVLLVISCWGVVSSLALSSLRVRPVEARWALLCFMFIFAGGLSIAFSPRPELGLMDIGRQLYIATMSFFMMIHFRKPENCVAFRKLLALPAVVGGGIILLGFWIIRGWPTLANVGDLASFKFDMVERFEINPNPLSFAVLLVFVLGWRGKGRDRPGWFLPYVPFVLASLFISGSRTAIVVLAGAMALNYLFRKPPSRFTIALSIFVVLLIVLIGLGTSGLIFSESDWVQTLFWLSEITTGRSELWGAAMQKVAERPLLGWGAFTWDLDLSRYLTLYSSDMGRFDGLSSGSFHNAYLTVLAEKGVLGFGAGLCLLGYGLSCSLRLYWSRKLLSEDDQRIASIAPVWVFLVILHGFSEQGGLFGYANAAVDFITYSGLALILAVFSRTKKLHGKITK